MDGSRSQRGAGAVVLLSKQRLQRPFFLQKRNFLFKMKEKHPFPLSESFIFASEFVQQAALRRPLAVGQRPHHIIYKNQS